MSVGTMSEQAILEFKAEGRTPQQAADYFASQGWPEPRKAGEISGYFILDNQLTRLDFHGSFQLVHGTTTYRITYTAADKLWRVYRVAREQQR